MRRFLTLLCRFRADERGAFGALFAVLAVVLIATSGAVVDYTSVEQARTRAQVALDAAALALQSSIYTQNTTWIKGKAQALLVERVGDTRISANVLTAVADTTAGELTLTARITVPLYFVSLVGINNMSVGLHSSVTRGSRDVEVAVALDVTGSMGGQKIIDLRAATSDLIDLVVKDVQTPTTSKLAMVPYSSSVNVAGLADSARGVPVTYTNITNISWLAAGSNRVISAISKQNPGRVTTTAAHGLTTGDTVYISNIAGGGFTALNARSFTITVISSTVFSLNGVSTSVTPVPTPPTAGW